MQRLSLYGGRVSIQDRFFTEVWLRWVWLQVISLDEFWWPGVFVVASLRGPFLGHWQWPGCIGQQEEAEQRQHEIPLAICSGRVGSTQQRAPQDIEVLTQYKRINLLNTPAQFALPGL